MPWWVRAADWPVVLREDSHQVAPHGSLVLRPLQRKDERNWNRLRAANASWLAPWEATDPARFTEQTPAPGTRPGLNLAPPVSYRAYINGLDRSAREGQCVPWVIELDGDLVGQVMVSGIVYGAQRSAVLGYWVSEHVAGRGIVPMAVAMAIDHCFDTLLLHRLELCIRPENTRSLRVAEKLSLRSEGLRLRYLHIDGDWRDHIVFAVTPEEVPDPGGATARLRYRLLHGTLE